VLYSYYTCILVNRTRESGDFLNLNTWGLAGGLAGGVRCADGLVGLVGLGLAGLPGPGLKSEGQ